MHTHQTHSLYCQVILFCTILVTLAALIGPPAPSAAAQNQSPITMDVEVGFDAHYRVQQWFPIAVLISNDGPDVRGVLEWRFPFQNDESTFQQEIDLPRGAHKRVMLYAMTSQFARTGEVRLLVGNRTLSREQVQIEAIGLEQFTIGVISSDQTLLNSLLAMEINNQDGVVNVLHFGTDMVPENAQALAGLDVLFIHDSNTATDLSEAQHDSLRLWTRMGGQLIISGGATAEHTTMGLQDMLPVSIDGLVSDGSLEALRLLARTADNAPDNTTLSSVSVQPDAESLDNDNLLIAQPYGNGRVIFSAFDLATLRGWNSEQELWERVIEAEPQFSPATALRNSGGNLLRDVLQLPALRLPSLGILLLFIIIYILAVGPINFFMLRRLKRVELAWITVPAIVLLFVVGTYGVGSLMRGQTPQVTHISVVQGFEGYPRGQTTAFIGIFSPHRNFYNLRFASETLISLPSFDTPRTSETPLVWDAAGTELRNALVDVSSIRTFIVEQPAASIPAIESSIKRDGMSITVEIENGGSEPLTNALLVYGSNWEQLETIAPGEREQVQLQSNIGSFPNNIFDFDVEEDALFNRQQMLNSLFGFDQFSGGALFVPAPDPNAWQENEPGMPNKQAVYLLTWSSQPAIDMEINRPSNEQSITLYVIRLAEQE